jgi:hypothetical protein
MKNTNYTQTSTIMSSSKVKQVEYKSITDQSKQALASFKEFADKSKAQVEKRIEGKCWEVSEEYMREWMTEDEGLINRYTFEDFMAGLPGLVLYWTKLASCYHPFAGGYVPFHGQFIKFGEDGPWTVDVGGEVIHTFFDVMCDLGELKAYHKRFHELTFSDPNIKAKLHKKVSLIYNSITKSSKGKRKKLHRKFMSLLAKSL